jgi:lycopene cyclase CruP
MVHPLAITSPRRPSPLSRPRGIARDILTAQQEQGLLEGDPLAALEHVEKFWRAARRPRSGKKGKTVRTEDATATVRVVDEGIASTFVTAAAVADQDPDPGLFDVAVCGGTLGIILALALRRRGLRVCVVERHTIQGRTQEWNISRDELVSLLTCGVLTEAELESCIVSEFGPIRVGFVGGKDLYQDEVLNLGVSPKQLIAHARTRFLALGGTLFEGTTFRSATVHPDGVALHLSPTTRPSPSVSTPTTTTTTTTTTAAAAATTKTPSKQQRLTARLLVDCMGHYSPIVAQMRKGEPGPEGMVVVVGGCHAPDRSRTPPSNNRDADLLVTTQHADTDMQLFWEAFPAEGGRARTTYMFTYVDAHPSRPDLEWFLDRYVTDLSAYQGIPYNEMAFKRVLCGVFPAYRTGPLRPRFPRVLQVGDAAAGQSPLSFGGFGSLLRHLPRLTRGIPLALSHKAHRSARKLGRLQPYQPSLSCAWLFQRAMTFPAGSLGERETVGSATTPDSSATASCHVDAAAHTSVPSSPHPHPPPHLPFYRQLSRSHVNDLLRSNFRVMGFLGERVLQPFLRDTIQFVPLCLTMGLVPVVDPLLLPRIVPQLGLGVIGDWMRHYLALWFNTAVHAVVRVLVKSQGIRRWLRNSYARSCWLDGLRWGTGMEHDDEGDLLPIPCAPAAHGEAQIFAPTSTSAGKELYVHLGVEPEPRLS